MKLILALSTAAALRAPSTGPARGSKLMAELLGKNTGAASMEPAVLDRYLALENKSPVVQAEYLFIDADGYVRSKCRTVPAAKASQGAGSLPKWTYDGSSTGQAPGDDSEVILVPRATYLDPFRAGTGAKNILVLCDTYDAAGAALPTNTRAAADELFAANKGKIPWYGIEQEYTLFNLDMTTPLGWPKNGYPGPQGPYYCSAGADRSFGRAVEQAHYKACLFAGLEISGTNAEVMPGQWEYQVGPCVGIDAADQLWVSRYILQRVCEDFGVHVTLDPKPISGDWNGAGCHTNFSTKKMRAAGGLATIEQAIRRLGAKHQEHIEAYGEGNERRLTGKYETADINTFSYGVANRGCSIRIPRSVEKDGYGYLEDRRPSSNCDPYVVTAKVFTTCTDESIAELD